MFFIRDVVEMAQTSLTFWTEALAMVRLSQHPERPSASPEPLV
jgi:hypothetical protein